MVWHTTRDDVYESLFTTLADGLQQGKGATPGRPAAMKVTVMRATTLMGCWATMPPSCVTPISAMCWLMPAPTRLNESRDRSLKETI